ncbi:MAG TPA: PDGLE domain-containing protein [Dermatophilaceae bacterium]|nr:PDGLE domain-containing protein [Dermatophilaceae bacterium]
MTRGRPSTRRLVAVGLVVSLLVAGVVSGFASSHPDGLEFVAGRLGFAGSGAGHAAADSPLADYAVRGVDGPLSGGLAGVLGVLVVGLVAFALGALLRHRSPSGKR